MFKKLLIQKMSEQEKEKWEIKDINKRKDHWLFIQMKTSNYLKVFYSLIDSLISFFNTKGMFSFLS